jgi:hypothetical protein
MVRDALAGATRSQIWSAFRSAVNGRRLVSDRRRELAEEVDPTAVRVAACDVLDVFSSPGALQRAVRGIVQADLAVFDVTEFEPAVMLLVGVRAATARGVTVCCHGGDWKEGTPLELPFNLQNLNVHSHTPSDQVIDEDPVVTRFVKRVTTGYRQMQRHGHYLDLPAYDDLRQLGADYDSSSTITVRERVLVLCSYKKEYFDQWRFVKSGLLRALSDHHNLSPSIERIIDHGTPQLVSQALFEQLRRSAACVIDWTHYSASAFMELGVRLAVSGWDAVHLVERAWTAAGGAAEPLEQIARLERMFVPLVYDRRAPADTFVRAANLLATRKPDAADQASSVHRVVVEALGSAQPASRTVYEELTETADALHHPKQGRVGAPQILFHRSFRLKHDSEQAALERRIAAWLYLDIRLKAAAKPKDDPLRERYVQLGRAAVQALYARAGQDDQELARFIQERLKE